MRSHDLISQTRYVRDARRLGYRCRDQRDSLMQPGRALSRLRARESIPVKRRNSIRPARAFRSRRPCAGCASIHRRSTRLSGGGKKKIAPVSAIGSARSGPVSSVERDTVWSRTKSSTSRTGAKVALSRYNRNRIFEKYEQPARAFVIAYMPVVSRRSTANGGSKTVACVTN